MVRGRYGTAEAGTVRVPSTVRGAVRARRPAPQVRTQRGRLVGVACTCPLRRRRAVLGPWGRTRHPIPNPNPSPSLSAQGLTHEEARRLGRHADS